MSNRAAPRSTLDRCPKGKRLSLTVGSAVIACLAAVVIASCASPASTRCDDSELLCPPGTACRGDRCISIACGDGTLEPDLGEQCDCGDESVGVRPEGCSGPNDDRVGLCRTDCVLHCGDGLVNDDFSEQCDGAPPAGLTCIDRGYGLGHLNCSATCEIDEITGCRYLGWEPLKPRLTSSNLRTIWGSGSDEIYAAGWDGAFLRYDGTRWELDPIDSSQQKIRFLSMWGRSSDGSLYLGGRNHLLRRDQSGGWETTPKWTDTVSGLWGMAGDSRVIAVGDDGTIRLYDGSAWTVETSPDPFNSDLHAVWGSGFNDIYAVGDNFTLLHRNSGGWAVLETAGDGGDDSDDDFNAIWGSGADDIYVSGDNGLRHFDGTMWTAPVLPSSVENVPLRGIWGTGPDNVFVVGNDGTTLHYDGVYWLALRETRPEHLYALWGTGSDNLYAVGNSGVVAYHSGVAWADTSPPTEESLNDVWGSSPTNIFAVGNDGTVFKYDGRGWTREALNDSNGLPLGIDADLQAIWGLRANDIYVAGDDGTLLHYNGLGWSTVAPMDASHDFKAIWGTSTGELFLAASTGSGDSERGLALRLLGDKWSEIGVSSQPLNSVWGSAVDDVWFAGEFQTGTLDSLLYVDQSGLAEPSPLPGIDDDLLQVWGSARDDVYIVGKDGQMWRFDGERWNELDSSTAQDLHSVIRTPRGVLAAGSNGAVVYDDGTGAGWQPVLSDTFERFNAMWADDRMVVMVGTKGVLEALVFTTPAPTE